MRCWQDPPGLLSLTKAFLPLRADRGPTVPTDTKTETAWAFLPPPRYPRDWLSYGRVRVELKDPITGAPLHPDFPSRRALLLKLGEESHGAGGQRRRVGRGGGG